MLQKLGLEQVQQADTELCQQPLRPYGDHHEIYEMLRMHG